MSFRQAVIPCCKNHDNYLNSSLPIVESTISVAQLLIVAHAVNLGIYQVPGTKYCFYYMG